MQNLTIDTGMQEYLINNRAVLRFNPSDPNLYHRFFAAAPKLDALDAELTKQLKALPAEPDDARAERGLALLTDYDHRIKALLTEIFGGENDFDKVLRMEFFISVKSIPFIRIAPYLLPTSAQAVNIIR